MQSIFQESGAPEQLPVQWNSGFVLSPCGATTLSISSLDSIGNICLRQARPKRRALTKRRSKVTERLRHGILLTMHVMPLRSFRLVCKPEQAQLVEGLLHAQGFAFEPEAFFPLARRLVHEPMPLGASLAALFGYIYIQDRSSMLPPLALAPEKGATVLDMCASPGSKTGLLAQLVGETGFVLANEPSGSRLSTLRRNLQTLNLFCCATMSYPGERLPLGGKDEEQQGLWDYIQLDPPCSGWGTVEKHPQAARLWQGDKIKPLISLQRKLLAEAARLLRPGGRVVYSTCTTNRAENEEQVRFALDELGLCFRPISPIPGFNFAEPESPELSGVLRVAVGPDGQGFFVALLEKTASLPGDTADVRSTADRLFQATQEADPWDMLPAPAEHETAGADRNEATTGQPQPLDKGHSFVIRPRGKGSRHVGEHRRFHTGRRGLSDKEPVRFVPREGVSGPYLDATLLPPGDIALFSSVAHFLPEGSRMLPGRDFSWKGFPLGRFGPGARLNPHLRALMPSIESLRSQGIACLDIDEPAPVLALLAGQSLLIDVPGPEIGLYFRGLPLCRLTVKGKRAVLPPV